MRVLDPDGRGVRAGVAITRSERVPNDRANTNCNDDFPNDRANNSAISQRHYMHGRPCRRSNGKQQPRQPYRKCKFRHEEPSP